MIVEKRTIRSDIPGHQTLLNGHDSSDSGTEETRRMIVGRGIMLRGEIAACEQLFVEGTVEATEFTAQHLDILNTGVFSGVAEVRDAVIAGRFEGRLIVTGRLIIKSGGYVQGEIEYSTLEIENGGQIEGRLTVRPPQSNVEPLFHAEDSETDDGTKDAPQVFRRIVGS